MIMLVDDDKVVLHVFSSMLENMKFTVVKFSESEVALDFFKNCSENVEVAILDFSMPQMNGDKLTEEIKKINSKAKVVGMSGDPKNKVAFKKSGCDGFLEKPFNRNKLQAVIEELIV